jgi:hypothetical protein
LQVQGNQLSVCCCFLLLQLHNCINPRACYRSNATIHKMADWAWNNQRYNITQLNSNRPLLDDYMRHMCNPGYEGPLCGACQEHPTPYGHSTHTCHECPRASINSFYYFIVSVFMFVVPVLNMWLHSQNVRKRSAQMRRANISSMQHAIGQPAAGVVQHESLNPASKPAADAAIAAGRADSGATTIELAALQQQQQQKLGAIHTVSDAYGALKPDQDVASAASSGSASKPGIIPTLQVSTASATGMSYSSTSSPTATINSASPFIQEQTVPSQTQPAAIRGMSATAAGAATAAAPSAGVPASNTLGARINSGTGRLFRHFFDHHLLDDDDVPRLMSTSALHFPQSVERFNMQQQQQQQKQQHRPARSMSMPVRRSSDDKNVLQGAGLAAAAGVTGAQQQFQRRSYKFWHTDIIMVCLHTSRPL